MTYDVTMEGKPVATRLEALSPEAALDMYLGWFQDDERPEKIGPTKAKIAVGACAGKVVKIKERK